MSVFMMKPESTPLLERVLNNVNYIYNDLWDEIGDPRVKVYSLFSGGPWTTIGIVSVYLYFVLFFGPRYMKNRKPFELNHFTLLYNIAMVLFNGWMFVAGLRITNFGLDAWGCQIVDVNSKEPRDIEKVLAGYLFFMSKIIELADTVIFILRKKSSQVTVLHVIHHSLVPLLIWTGYKISPGGNMALFPIINSLIHTVMYTYYGLTLLGPEVRKFLWWKKYLTTVQMIQFVIVMVHSLHVLFLPNCNFPKVLLYLSFTNAMLFLVLFYSFYRHAYGSSKAAAKSRELDAANPNCNGCFELDAKTKALNNNLVKESLKSD